MSSPANQPPITPQLLLRAYSIGMFPMAESANDPNLFWVDPEERGIFPLDGIIVSHSLAKVVRSDRFTVHADRDFDGVIAGCAARARGRRDTWINDRIRALYRQLFHLGYVHTVECYDATDRLVGGLYGVSIGGAFFGESMFHRASDASKVALVHLAARVIHGGFALLDTQFVTPHLKTLGAVEISREEYHRRLDAALGLPADFLRWPKDKTMSGKEALSILQARSDSSTST
jgi:leucyl/phenylalanyl-tRNA--protein transferase